MAAFCAVVQVICAFVTLCLTVYVVLRDTRHMNEQDERQEMAEKLAQLSSIAAWLERDPTGETFIVIRNDSDLPVYEVVAIIVVTNGAGCCKGEDLESSYQYRKILDLIPPGLHSVANDMGGFYGMHRHPLVEIAFVCAKGKSWVRREMVFLMSLMYRRLATMSLVFPLILIWLRRIETVDGIYFDAMNVALALYQ